jgi:hypothetical protein
MNPATLEKSYMQSFSEEPLATDHIVPETLSGNKGDSLAVLTYGKGGLVSMQTPHLPRYVNLRTGTKGTH